MQKVTLVLACLACTGSARRVISSIELQNSPAIAVLDARNQIGHITPLSRLSDESKLSQQSDLFAQLRGGAISSDYETQKFHRFVTEEDATFEEYVFNDRTGFGCKTPRRFEGARKDGSIAGSFRVQFTLPGKDDDPKTIELVQSRGNDNPSFGAVRVKLPIDATVVTEEGRLVVRGMKEESNADKSSLMVGDIIRGVSYPDTDGAGVATDNSWQDSDFEEGMVMLGGKRAASIYNSVIQANLRSQGAHAEVVLLIERPATATSKDAVDEGFIWAFPGYKKEKFHRFVQEDDATFEEYTFSDNAGYTCKTSDKFEGTRKDGSVTGSFRVQFTLPDRDDEPKTLELLQSNPDDKPLFGSVKVKLPIEATVISEDGRLVVNKVKEESNAENSRIAEGDIIRAVSLPKSDSETPWWTKIGRGFDRTETLSQDSEEGMAIVDGQQPDAIYDAALQENFRVNGDKAEVVLVIERPAKAPPKDSDTTREEEPKEPNIKELPRIPPSYSQAGDFGNAGAPPEQQDLGSTYRS